MCSRMTRVWFDLLAVKGVSTETWLALTGTMTVEEVAEMLTAESGRMELSRLMDCRVDKPDPGLREKAVRFTGKQWCGAISLNDESYPGLLREIEKPPPVIFYRGDLSVLKQPSICVVGSRSATRRGRITARNLAAELAGRGFLVVSGLARGIDTMAHRGALDRVREDDSDERWKSWTLMNVDKGDREDQRNGGSPGVTCAVLGCGIDVPYPVENAGLAVEIARHGCILSEFLPGTPPLKHHFPRRNRILSGLCLGTVVVEAGERSGAMNTARWAVEQNREVFAVPGPIESSLSRGPHRLIRQGACLIESAGQIVAELPPCGRILQNGKTGEKPEKTTALSPGEKTILKSLEINPKHIDEIIKICNISPVNAQSVLLELELKGLVERCEGGTFALAAGFLDTPTDS